MEETSGLNPQVPKGDQLTSLRFAIVGFGKLAQKYYVPPLRSLDRIHLVAVADPLPACQSAAKDRIPNVTTYSAHQDLLEHEALDAILVASPPSTHLQIWNDACKSEVAVFMEKPFVLKNELARVESSPQARRLLMVNFNRRFWPTYRRLGELSRSGQIGNLEHAEFVLHVNVLEWCSVTAHRLSPGEGGVLYDLGSQMLDLVWSIFSEEPVSILAEIRSKRWVSDHVALGLDFSSGLHVRCELAYGERTRESVVIQGSRGRLRLDNPNMTIHLELKDSPPHQLADRCRDAFIFGYRAVRRDRSMLRYTIRASIETFLRSLRVNERFSPGFEDAAKNTMWLEAALRSAAEERPVVMNSTAGGY